MPTSSPRIGCWYRLSVPWFWLIVALISWKHPGDEYGLFGIANGLPSAWISIWFRNTGSPNDVFPTMIACSFVSMLLLSWAMDRLRVPWWLVLVLWLLGTKVLFDLSYGQFESHLRAIAKNGSMTAYVSASSNLSLFLTCAGSIAMIGLYRVVVALDTVRDEKTAIASE